jgi:hypothetical protein
VNGSNPDVANACCIPSIFTTLFSKSIQSLILSITYFTNRLSLIIGFSLTSYKF